MNKSVCCIEVSLLLVACTKLDLEVAKIYPMPFSDTKNNKDIVYGPDLAKIGCVMCLRILRLESLFCGGFLLRR